MPRVRLASQIMKKITKNLKICILLAIVVIAALQLYTSKISEYQFTNYLFPSGINNEIRLGPVSKYKNLTWAQIDGPKTLVRNWRESNEWEERNLSSIELDGWLGDFLNRNGFNKDNIKYSFTKIINESDVGYLIIFGNDGKEADRGLIVIFAT